MEYKVIRSDDIVTISYGTSINKTKSGNHVVWMKAEYHDPKWQRDFSSQIESKTLIATTLTKAWYDEYYASCMVRRVLLYSKAGRLLFDTGEISTAEWGYVNASDPVGLVVEERFRLFQYNLIPSDITHYSSQLFYLGGPQILLNQTSQVLIQAGPFFLHDFQDIIILEASSLLPQIAQTVIQSSFVVLEADSINVLLKKTSEVVIFHQLLLAENVRPSTYRIV